jgi:hypothetical protein
MTPDALCLALAATQFGVIARAQALERGMSPKMMKTRVACGRWIRLFPGVYAIAGVPPTFRGWLLAAQLWLGERAVVSHRAAAVVWGLDGIDGELVELTVVGSRPQSPQGVILHYARELPRSDIRRRGPFRLTSIERTLVDIGAVATRAHVEPALESALFRRLSTFERLRSRCEDLRGPGRRGPSVLAKLLDERDPDQAAAESFFETRFYRLLKDSPLSMGADYQHRVTDDAGFVARLDVAYPVRLAGMEAYSLRWHSGRARVKRDIPRHNRLTELGWRILYVLYEDLDRRPRQTLDRLDRFLSNCDDHLF